MAVTKVYAVRNQLKRAVEYAANEDKTSLDNIINYAANPSKTEQRLFESAINCLSVGTAYEEMTATKRKYSKEDKVLAYHYIQSFDKGEVTPELAHKIGVEFARECFGDRFEVVIGTHLDKEHLHNHIVVNSVSFTDGGKLRSTPESYYSIIRCTSDRLCKEYELSVIKNPKGKGMHYAEWKAVKEGKPTIRGQIRQELDDIIALSKSYIHFWELLRKRGYLIKRGPNITHTAIKPPFASRYIRLRSLGEEYTEENIKQRIITARNGIRTLSPQKQPKRYRIKGDLKEYPRKKLKGFMALYFRYLYLFKKIRKRKAPQKVSFFMREEIIKFERYQKQFRFLYDNKIETTEQLKMYQSETEIEMNRLIEHRKELYKERGDVDEKVKEEITKKISSVSEQIRVYRKTIRLCKAISDDAARIQEKYTQAKDISSKELAKEAKSHEHKRRSR